MKNTMQKAMWAIAAAIFCILVVHTPAQAMMTEDQADGKSIYRIQNGEYAEMTMTVGKQGTFTYDLTGLTDPMDGSAVTTLQVTSISTSNSEVLQMNADGSFTAVAPGEATVSIQGTYGTYNMYFSGRCDVTVVVDMTNVTLEKNSVKGIYSGYVNFETSVALQNVPAGIFPFNPVMPVLM